MNDDNFLDVVYNGEPGSVDTEPDDDNETYESTNFYTYTDACGDSVELSVTSSGYAVAFSLTGVDPLVPVRALPELINALREVYQSVTGLEI